MTLPKSVVVELVKKRQIQGQEVVQTLEENPEADPEEVVKLQL